MNLYGFWPSERTLPRWNQIHSSVFLGIIRLLQCFLWSLFSLHQRWKSNLYFGADSHGQRLWIAQRCHCAKIGNTALVHCLDAFILAWLSIHLIAWVLENSKYYCFFCCISHTANYHHHNRKIIYSSILYYDQKLLVSRQKPKHEYLFQSNNKRIKGWPLWTNRFEFSSNFRAD